MKQTILFLLLLWGHFSFAQTLSSSIDKEKINLGEVITMTINVRDLQGKEVISAQENKLLPSDFEIYSDEISQDKEQYIRTITFTIFEKRKFQIPALKFQIGDSIHHTIPYEIEVFNSAQSNDEIEDIMDNETVKLNLIDYWELYASYIIAGIFALILIWFLFLRDIKFKKETSDEDTIKDGDYYRNLALKSLERLQEKNYPQKGESRLFYIELLEITRHFLNGKYNIPAQILLTEDLIDFLAENTEIAPRWQTYLQDVFTRGDFAKFGKYNPPAKTMEQDFGKIRHMISTMKDHL